MSDISFNRPMLYSPASSGDLWELAADWSLVYEGEVYRIPMGFKTDGASIPRFLWRLCGTPLEVPRLYAALVHDFLYAGGDPEATREDADKLFRDIQIALGVSKWKAYTEYYALRMCGSSHWESVQKCLAFVAFMIGIAACCAGCQSDRVKNLELDGMFTQTETGTIAIGSIEVMASPKGEESAIIKYGEDTAWLSPSTKTHSIKILLSGSNCVEKVDKIVENICKAFVPTVAIVNGVEPKSEETKTEDK